MSRWSRPDDRTVPPRPGGPAAAGLLLVDARRSLYRGLLAQVDERSLGGVLIYAALGRAFGIRIGDGPWQTASLAVLTPYSVHSLRGGREPIAQVLLEQDDVDLAALPAWLQRDALDPLPAEAAAALCQRLADLRPCAHEQVTQVLDDATLGRPLAPRRLDARVRRVLDRMAADPGAAHPAAQCAAASGLSVSRFLHLFTAEVGVPFRRLRAWKRARWLLALMQDEDSLTQIALSAGYAHSSHFSNAIRDAYGLRPRDILASRGHLQVVCPRGLPQSPGLT